MTDGGIKALADNVLQRVLTLNGGVALIGFLALIVGFLIGSALWWIVCGLIVFASAMFVFVPWRTESESSSPVKVDDGIHIEPPSPEGAMKRLLFDDFQSPAGNYVVKKIEEENDVVPSSKKAQPAPMLREETMRELEILDFFDLDGDGSYAEAEPKSEFHSLVNKVLLVLKEVLFAHTVAFFWINREKRQLVVESMATDSKLFMAEKRFGIETDFVSQIATQGKPQILGRVNPSSEPELLRYYESPALVNSVLGVPVFFKNGSSEIQPVGVIVADSKAEDAFGQETLALMGHFTKLVSALVKSYTDKYDLLLDSELLASIRRMQDRIRSDANEQAVLAALADEANRLANWDFLTITMYSEAQHGWVLQKVVNKVSLPYVAPDQLVDVTGSVVSGVIGSNRIEMIPDLDGEDSCRFYASEKIESKGSFLCIPVSSFNRCYGALTLESRNTANFSGNEVETIYRLVENAAAALEVLYMNDLVKDYVSVDHLTGLMTRKHFMRTLEEEVRRAEDFSAELSFVSLSVDGIAEHCSRYGKDVADVILNDVAKIIRGNVRTYDILGRQEIDCLGVLLIQTAASEAYLWAEKIRKIIAGHVVILGTRSFSVTVSAGVCGLTSGMLAGELIAGTSQVLGKAVESGGNLVRVF